MRFKELSLWLLFLTLCFGAGYIKGYFPAESWPSLWGGPTEVEILLHDERLLPTFAREEIQKELKVQIRTLVVKDREEFSIRTITSPGYHLALIPEHWMAPAVAASQMSNLNPLLDDLTQEVSTDFRNPAETKIYSFPLYWVSTHFVIHNPTSQPLKHWYLNSDWDFISDKMKRLKLDKSVIHPSSLWEMNFDLKNLTPGAYEVSHVVEAQEQQRTESLQPDLRSLYIWSLVTPRHSPSRKLTLKLIKKIKQSGLQERIVKELQVASTLAALNDTSLPRYKKPLFIRELDLSTLKSPQWLGLEQVKSLKKQF